MEEEEFRQKALDETRKTVFPWTARQPMPAEEWSRKRRTWDLQCEAGEAGTGFTYLGLVWSWKDLDFYSYRVELSSKIWYFVADKRESCFGVRYFFHIAAVYVLTASVSSTTFDRNSIPIHLLKLQATQSLFWFKDSCFLT